MQKNCANCKNSYIKDGCYLICEIDGIQNDVVENCENFEVGPDLISQLEKENKELKAKNEQLKEEINDFISDISTCGFKYDGRDPDDLDELRSSIEYLCNKFDNYKHTLKETQDEVLSVCKRCRTNITSFCENCSFEKILRKAQKIDLSESEGK